MLQPKEDIKNANLKIKKQVILPFDFSWFVMYKWSQQVAKKNTISTKQQSGRVGDY